MTSVASERPARPARWILPKAPDEEAVRALAAALSLPEIVCRLLLIRGYVTAEEAELFPRPKLDRLHGPRTFLSVEKPCEGLARAARERPPWFSPGASD